MASHTGFSPPDDAQSSSVSNDRSRSSPEMQQGHSKAPRRSSSGSQPRVPALSTVVRYRAHSAAASRPARNQESSSSSSSEEDRQLGNRGGGAQGMEIVGVSSTGSQNVPVVFAPGGQHSPLPNPLHNMPAAAFVAGAAVAKASQAADIAHRAAHAAEHYYNESQQAQALAHTIHDHAVQREQQFQQAAAVLRGEAEGMVLESRAQAEAVAQQAKEFVANREREVEHQARQWASSQEAAMHQQVHGLSQQAHHVLGEKQAEIDHLRQENLRLAQELQAKALAVPIPPASVRSEAMPECTVFSQAGVDPRWFCRVWLKAAPSCQPGTGV